MRTSNYLKVKTQINSQPAIGILYYGNEPIGKPDTFRNIGALRRALIANGFDQKLFHKHYFNGSYKINSHNFGSDSNADISASVNTEYSNNAPKREKYLPQTSTNEMTLQQYIITDFRDPTWLNNYIAAMGEEAFWNYKRKLYFMLDQLKIGECIEVQTWVKPENLDLFMKISCCFVQESRGNYQFNNKFTIITHKYDDAREMESTLRLLRTKRREKETGGDGTGAGSGIQGTIPVPAP